MIRPNSPIGRRQEMLNFALNSVRRLTSKLEAEGRLALCNYGLFKYTAGRSNYSGKNGATNRDAQESGGQRSDRNTFQTQGIGLKSAEGKLRRAE